jgi:hypothetical protein
MKRFDPSLTRTSSSSFAWEQRKGQRIEEHATPDHPAPVDSHQTTCCGLFCLSALPAEIGVVIAGIALGPALSPTPAPHIPSQSPERPHRPPISPLFV